VVVFSFLCWTLVCWCKLWSIVFLYKLLFVFLNSKNHLSQKIQKQKTTNRHLQRRLVCGRHFKWRLGAEKQKNNQPPFAKAVGLWPSFRMAVGRGRPTADPTLQPPGLCFSSRMKWRPGPAAFGSGGWFQQPFQTATVD
jgi:hypothetical protein